MPLSSQSGQRKQRDPAPHGDATGPPGGKMHRCKGRPSHATAGRTLRPHGVVADDATAIGPPATHGQLNCCQLTYYVPSAEQAWEGTMGGGIYKPDPVLPSPSTSSQLARPLTPLTCSQLHLAIHRVFGTNTPGNPQRTTAKDAAA